MSISFEQITKRYAGTPVVNDVSLQIQTGEFFVLLGPSGSGKSTLLRAAAGLADIDHGRIGFHGRDVTHLAARERGVGLVFQHYALFRHMSVGENVEFALRVRGVKRAVRRQRRDELLQLVALEGMAERMPGQLSGGQQQRVAVARALAHEPAVLLLDEPFGALDAKIRVELRDTIRQVQRRLGMTTILVTHDQEEAFALADRIGVMHNGRLLETGPAELLYRHPATRFVATFLGAANLFLGELSAGTLRLGDERIPAADLHQGEAAQEAVTVIRPEDIEVCNPGQRPGCPLLATGHVSALGFAGNLQRVRVELAASDALRSAITAPEGAETRALSIDVTRTPLEQQQLPLTPGRRVTLGVRRWHLLPTPISSFRLLAGPDDAERLRQAPLLRQLTGSMRAHVTTAAGADTASIRSGVAVLPLAPHSFTAIEAALQGGSNRLLLLPAEAQLPQQVFVLSDDDSRRQTLALVASVMRHLHAEVSFVTVQNPQTRRSELASAFRRSLDARAELLESHGLELRSDVQLGELPDWVARTVAAERNALVVIGLGGTPPEILAQLQGPFQALFSGHSRCPVLISCTGASAPQPRTAAADATYPAVETGATAPARE